MRKSLFLLAFLLYQFNAIAQLDVEINAIVLKYPSRFSSPEKLAYRINRDFTTESAKARAIYSWMAFNIRYDVKKFRNPPKRKGIKYKTAEELLLKQQKVFDQQVNKTIRSRKGICGDYSALYYKVATLVGLHCEMNQGAAKTEKYDVGKRRAIIDHGWNSVQIDGDWKLLDVTWGAGYVDDVTDKFEPNYNLFYFDTPKELFFTNHYPEKGIWHDVTVDKKQFLDAPLVYHDHIIGYKIIEPKTGVIEIKKDEKLQFKIENLALESDIKYSLKAEDETAEITSKKVKDNILEFKIKIDKTIGRYLTLFIDGQAIATYKINRK